MKAYRSGAVNDPMKKNFRSGLWWFGAGNIPHWMYGGLRDQYKNVGQHRGEYKPRRHWTCKTCTSNCNCPIYLGTKTLKLSVYNPPGGEHRKFIALDNAQKVIFPVQ